MTRTQLYLPQSQYEELKQHAQKRGITFAELAREFLEEKLSELKKKSLRRKSINSVKALLASVKEIEKYKEKKGGVRDGSVNHDHYLYGWPKREE